MVYYCHYNPNGTRNRYNILCSIFQVLYCSQRRQALVIYDFPEFDMLFTPDSRAKINDGTNRRSWNWILIFGCLSLRRTRMGCSFEPIMRVVELLITVHTLRVSQ